MIAVNVTWQRKPVSLEGACKDRQQRRRPLVSMLQAAFSSSAAALHFGLWNRNLSGVNGGELSARLSAVKAGTDEVPSETATRSQALAAETPDSAATAAAVLGTCLEESDGKGPVACCGVCCYGVQTASTRLRHRIGLSAAATH